jgi:hypothetical protein
VLSTQALRGEMLRSSNSAVRKAALDDASGMHGAPTGRLSNV